MVAVESTMLPLGTQAPEFDLPDTNPNTGSDRVRLADLAGSPFVIAFICNHCPYVKHIAPVFAKIGNDLQARGVRVVAISSNDADKYPDDGPDRMVDECKDRGFSFPYLYDETQEVAKAYTAACTPDLFLFDRAGRLAYRGQFDESRPKNGVPVTGKDLVAAAEAVLDGRPVPEPQTPSIGCNIKWRPGNAPAYFG